MILSVSVYMSKTMGLCLESSLMEFILAFLLFLQLFSLNSRNPALIIVYLLLGSLLVYIQNSFKLTPIPPGERLLN